MKEGLDAVRVQRVAADVGVTDAAIHYHFGSHAGLIEALLRHCAKELSSEIAAADAEPIDLRAVSRALKRVYVDAGAARMLAWLTLSGWRPRGSGMLSGLVDNLHAQRVAAAAESGKKPPHRTDSKYLVMLLSAAHLAQAIFGEALLKAVDAPAGRAGQQRFLSWLTSHIAELSGLADDEP